MKKFWEWKNQTKDSPVGRTIFLNGTIAEESWFDDDVTPQLFKDELMSGEGDVTVWINSPGGDCIAAAQIYNMLKEYPGNITVKVDGLAASAASVIAMAGDTVLMSPVSMMMIHNPATIAMGDHTVMQQVIDMLDEVKESIINAYVIKSGQSRAKLSHLMDMETWLSARKALELGLADICNVHYAKITVTEEGEVTFATPVAMPGAVSISMNPTGEPESFYADGIEYYVINNNQGYEGDLELKIDDLNIRKGPGTTYAKVGKYTGKGIFTIVDEIVVGESKWGLLKSYEKNRDGWICLDYAEEC